MPNCSFVEVTKKKKKVSCTRVAVGKGYIGEVESWLCEEHGGKETICGRGTSHVGDKFCFFIFMSKFVNQFTLHRFYVTSATFPFSEQNFHQVFSSPKFKNSGGRGGRSASPKKKVRPASGAPAGGPRKKKTTRG